VFSLLNIIYLFFFWRDSPQWAGPLHSRGFYITYNDAPQSVGLPWAGDQLVAETSIWHHTTFTTNIHVPGRIRTHNHNRRAPADRVATGTGH